MAVPHNGPGRPPWADYRYTRRVPTFCQRLDAEIVGVWINVNKIDGSPAIKCTIRGSDKGIGCGPEPVTRSQPESKAGNVQGACGRVDATPYCASTFAATARSKRGTIGPWVIKSERRTETTASISDSEMSCRPYGIMRVAFQVCDYRFQNTAGIQILDRHAAESTPAIGQQ